jgi:glycine/D-amino acid oxidase-like deaminating enzyme
MKHTIIVGLGLAGFNYALYLQKQKKEFLIVDSGVHRASENAAGVCNPTVLKRYTMAWQGHQFLQYAKKQYQEFELKIDQKVFLDQPIHRYFNHVSEHNDWSIAAQGDELKFYLDASFSIQAQKGIRKSNGYGMVQNTGRLKITKAINAFRETLNSDQYLQEKFDYDALDHEENKVSYKGYDAQQIVFCEGYGLKRNPWFNYLPLTGSKGEFLVIQAPDLSREQIVKGGIFIVPIEKDLFWVGATFSPKDKTYETTQKGKQWLLTKLDNLIDTDYIVRSQGAGIRPTVMDRRPLLGQHPKLNNMYLFNGLGTRGVLMAPLLAHWLYCFINNQKELPTAVAIDRFESYFSKPKIEDV